MGIKKHSFVGNPNRQNYVDDEEELLFLSGDEISLAGPDLLIDDTYDIVTDDDEDYQPDDYEDFISDSDYEYGDNEASESGLEQVFFSDTEQEIPHESLGDSDIEDVQQHKTTPDKTDNRTNGEIRTTDSGEADSNQAADGV